MPPMLFSPNVQHRIFSFCDSSNFVKLLRYYIG